MTEVETMTYASYHLRHITWKVTLSEKIQRS